MKLTVLNRLSILAAVCYVSSCVYKELPTGFECVNSSLAISLVSKTDATSCKSIDGQITMSASGGTGPYDYSLGNGIYQTNPVFEKLAPGSYTVTVKDHPGCTNAIQVELNAANSTLTGVVITTADTNCFSPHNGLITVNPTGGSSPYLVKLDNGTFSSSTIFPNQASGPHSIILKDADDCEKIFTVSVGRGNTGISYANEIAPIFTANCNFNGCHGSGTTGRDWTKFSDIRSKAESIKIRTSNRSMPIGGFTLTEQQIQQIACWVDDGANNN